MLGDVRKLNGENKSFRGGGRCKTEELKQFNYKRHTK